MSNRFMSYFGGGSGSEADRFVGQLLDLGEGNKLKVKKVIAEGKSCSYHWKVIDVLCLYIIFGLCVFVYL